MESLIVFSNYKKYKILNILNNKVFNIDENNIKYKINYYINDECKKILGNMIENKYLKIKKTYSDLYSLEYNKIYNILQELNKYIVILKSNKFISKRFIYFFNKNKRCSTYTKVIDYSCFEEYKKIIIDEIKELIIDIEKLLNDKLRVAWIHLVVSSK